MVLKSRYLGMLWDVGWLLWAGLMAYGVRSIQSPVVLDWSVSWPYLIGSSLAGLTLWRFLGVHRRSYRHATRQDGHRLGLIAVTAPILGLMVSFLSNLGEDLPRAIPVLHVGLLLVGLLGARLVGKAIWQVQVGSRARETSQSAPASDRYSYLVGDSVGITSYLKARQLLGLDLAGKLVVFSTDPQVVGLTIRGMLVQYHASMLDNVEASRLQQQQPGQSERLNLIVAVPASAWSSSLRSSVANWSGPVLQFGPVEVGAVCSEADAGPNVMHVPQLTSVVRAYLPLKRLMDIAASVILILLTALPFLLAVAGVRAFLGSPVLFWQWRPGLHGYGFKLVKLRSMRSPVDRNGRILADQERLGRFGRALRRSRLDEVPQLWSILTGDMSLIGPRPLIHQQQRASSRRLLMRPGLSGWAQVNGGQLLNTQNKEDLDVWYVDNASLMVDLKIIVMTIGAVLFGDRVPAGMRAKSDPLAGAELSGNEQSAINRPMPVGAGSPDPTP